MRITVFKKKVTPRNGNKPFYKYVTTLTKKDGTRTYCDVKFDAKVSIPAEFPVVIEFNKNKANMSYTNFAYTDSDGNEKTGTRYSLWVTEIENLYEYVDNSLDDFE